jgi:anti-sigma regulatory factor (Ser/Thr protein kinase)
VPTAEWALPAAPRSVSALRTRVVGFAAAHGVPDQTLSALAIATSEALTNAVQHAFPERAPGTISAKVDIDELEGRVLLIVSDNGLGMTLRPDSPGFGPGLSIMSRMADEFVVEPGFDGFGTDVRMTFEVAPAALAAGVQAVPEPAGPRSRAPAGQPGDPAKAFPPPGSGIGTKLGLGILALGSVALWGGLGYAALRLVL